MAQADAPVGASPATLAATAAAARGTGAVQAGVPCLDVVQEGHAAAPSPRFLSLCGRGKAGVAAQVGVGCGTAGAVQAGVGCRTGAHSVLVLHVLPIL